MINELEKVKAELIKFFTDFRDRNGADHNDLVQVVNYALDEVKNPAAPTGTLTPKGEAELKAKQDAEAKKTTKAPSGLLTPGSLAPSPSQAAQTQMTPAEKTELATSKTHL